MQNNNQTNAKKDENQKSYVASGTSFTPNSSTAKKASSKFSKQVKQTKSPKNECDRFTIEEEWEIGIDSPCSKH